MKEIERAWHSRGNKNYFLGWKCEQRDPTIQRNVRKPDRPRGLLTWPAATDWQIAAMCHSSCLHSYLGKTNRAHAWIICKNTFDVTTWIIWDLSETFSGSHEEDCSVYELRRCFAQALAKLARPNRYNKLYRLPGAPQISIRCGRAGRLCVGRGKTTCHREAVSSSTIDHDGSSQTTCLWLADCHFHDFCSGAWEITSLLDFKIQVS